MKNQLENSGSYLGFTDDKSALQKGRIETCLDKVFRYSDGVMARKDAMLLSLRNGKKPEVVEEANKKSYRMSWDNYYNDITKTEYDFCIYLIEHDLISEESVNAFIDAENLNYTDISVAVKGSGDIVLKNMKVDNVNAEIAGSGDIEMKGTAQHAILTVNGSGDISAGNLVTTNVIATVSGSGDIECYASKQLSARVGGSGDIEYRGNPAVVNKEGRKDQISIK